LLDDMAMMMLKRFLYLAEGGGVRSAGDLLDTVAGIVPSGVPLATLIAAEEGRKLSVYFPAKHSRSETPTGARASSLSTFTGHSCIVIDDFVTTGTSLSLTLHFLRRHGATPGAVWSLFDKRVVREVDGVPVHSLFAISRLW